MNIRTVLFLISFFLNHTLWSQSLDSLKRALLSTDSNNEKIELYCAIAVGYSPIDILIAQQYADSAAAMIGADIAPVKIYKAYNIKASLYMNQGQLDSAAKYFQQQKELLDSVLLPDIEVKRARYYSNIATMHYSVSEFDSAFHNFLRAKQLYESLNDSVFVARMNSNVGVVMYQQNNYQKALIYYKNAQKIIEASSRDTVALLNIYNNIGIVFSDLASYEQAETYFLEGLKMAEQVKMPIYIEMLQFNLGDLYYDQNRYDEALVLYKASKKIKEKNNIPFGNNLSRIGSYYFQIDNYTLAKKYLLEAEEALLKVNDKVVLIDTYEVLCNLYRQTDSLEQALFYVFKAEKLAENIIGDKRRLAIYKNIIDLSFDLAQFENAQKYFRLYQILLSSITNEDLQSKIYEIEASYELEIKSYKDSIRLKDNKLSLNKSQISLLMGLILLGALLFTIYYIKSRNTQLKIKMEHLNLISKHNALELQQSKLLLSKKQDDFSALVVHLETLKNDLSEDQLNKLISSLNSTNVVEKNWEDYLAYFQKMNPNFVAVLALRGIKLTQSELRLCSLIQQGLTIGEISHLLKLQYKSVETYRYRLRKKLQLAEQDDLRDFINDLSK